MSSSVLGSLSFLDTPDVNGNLVLTTATGLAPSQLVGTAGALTIVQSGANYVFDVADNTVFGGILGITIPVGTTANRPSTPATGQLRFNSTISANEVYNGSFWVPEGRVLQVATGTIAGNSTTVVVAPSATAPTQTGALLFTQTFTPISATSRIIVSFPLNISSNTAGIGVTATVFSGTTAKNVAVGRTSALTPFFTSVPVQAIWNPGSTATITITVYGVAQAASTIYFNTGATVWYGGLTVTQYTITEVA